jgi:SHS2 domain-containing protein
MISNNPPFEVSDHSGDLRITAYGSDEMEALANASCGLISQIVDINSVDEVETRNISVEGEDETARSIAFLNELIYLIDAHHWIPARVKRLTTCAQSGCERIEALLAGQAVDLLRHEFKYDIKAVTWHEFKITREYGRVTIQFVCDL